MQLYCAQYLNNAYRFYWRSMGCAMLTPRKGFWFAFTCVCSLYILLKTLLMFHNSKSYPHRGNVEQVQAPDQSNQDKSIKTCVTKRGCR